MIACTIGFPGVVFSEQKRSVLTRHKTTIGEIRRPQKATPYNTTPIPLFQLLVVDKNKTN